MAWSASRPFGHGLHLWGFDSFEGLPEQADARDDHPRWQAGSLATAEARFHELCAEAEMGPRDYSVVTGYYSTTLVAGAPGPRPETVAFAYVDCDLYSSTRDGLTFLEHRLRPGSVLAFDDYYCYAPSGPSGERLAAKEHFATSAWVLVPYIQCGWHGMSFVVERREGGLVTEVGW
jgi:O-methyltransferase